MPAMPDITSLSFTDNESGLRWADIETGSGAEAIAGCTASVHYSGWFEDGVGFDSSHDRGRPFEVEDLGEGQVVRLDGTTVVVVDQPTGQRWVIRRAACGETCCCAVQGWPVGYDGPISPADPYAALSMLATSVREFRRLSKLEAG